MHVSKYRKARLLLNLREDSKPRFEPRPAIRGRRRAIRFVVRSLENQRDAELLRRGPKLLGNAHRMAFAFDHARSRDNEKRRVAANADFADREAARRCHRSDAAQYSIGRATRR